MLEIRIHGRGGQGAVVASKILARAAFLEGRYVQVFPQFGVERRGAPVVAFLRVSDRPIRRRTHIYHPDHIMVMDPALLNYINVTEGLKDGGWILINSPTPPEAFDAFTRWRVATVDASRIALEHGIGTATQPIVNTTMIGAFARVTGLARFENLAQAIEETLDKNAEINLKAARTAWDHVFMQAGLSNDAFETAYLNR